MNIGPNVDATRTTAAVPSGSPAGTFPVTVGAVVCPGAELRVCGAGSGRLGCTVVAGGGLSLDPAVSAVLIAAQDVGTAALG